MWRAAGIVGSALMLGGAPTAEAQQAPGRERPRVIEPEKPDTDEVFSVSFAPAHLIYSILLVTAEARVVPHFGIALLGGDGQVAGYRRVGFDVVASERVSLARYEFGARFVGYPFRRFKGVQLGVELMHLRVGNDSVSQQGIWGSGAISKAGPFFGYKYVTPAGFTLISQFGAEYSSGRRTSSSGSGQQHIHGITPLLNVELGWSF